MVGIDNNFLAKYNSYKSNGLTQNELRDLRKDVSGQTPSIEGSKKLASEISRDGQIDQNEQQLLQVIGQGAKDETTAKAFASSIDPTNSEISKLIMLGFRNKPTTNSATNLDISKMGSQEKIIEAFKGSLKYVGPELRTKLEAMLTKENLAIMAGTLAVYAGAHAVGVGFVADAALLGLGAITLGSDAIDVAKKMYGFTEKAINATTPLELDAASQELGKAMATIVSDIPALIGVKNTKVSTNSVGIKLPSMDGGALALAGGGVLAAENVVTVVYPTAIKITKANASVIGSTVMMASAPKNGSGNQSPEGTTRTEPTIKVPNSSKLRENGIHRIDKANTNVKGDVTHAHLLDNEKIAVDVFGEAHHGQSVGQRIPNKIANYLRSLGFDIAPDNIIKPKKIR